jgi:hypothetical protein
MSSEDFNGLSGPDFMANGADHRPSAKTQV